MAADIIHLSGIVHSPLLGSDGERWGRVEDVIARQGEQAHPPVSGNRREDRRPGALVPISMIGSVRPGCVSSRARRSTSPASNGAGRASPDQGPVGKAPDQHRRRPSHPCERDRDRAGRRHLRVIGVARPAGPSCAGCSRACLAQRIPSKAIVDWESIQPFVSHVPDGDASHPYRNCRLHPPRSPISSRLRHTRG